MAYRDLSVETDAKVGAAGIPSVTRWLGLNSLASCSAVRGGAAARGATRMPILRGVQGVLQPVSVLHCAHSDAACLRLALAPAYRSAVPTAVRLQGRLTLLLGPPGSGKSVFLQRIAGQLQASKSLRVRPAPVVHRSQPVHHQRRMLCPGIRCQPSTWHRMLVPLLQLSGQVLYNGHDGSEFLLRNTASYVDQYDVHVPLLTVRETLVFAQACLWEAGAKHDMHEEFHKVRRLAARGDGVQACSWAPGNVQHRSLKCRLLSEKSPPAAAACAGAGSRGIRGRQQRPGEEELPTSVWLLCRARATERCDSQ